MDRPETVIALSAVARNSGPIAVILQRGPSKSHSVGTENIRENIILGPFQPLGS